LYGHRLQLKHIRENPEEMKENETDGEIVSDFQSLFGKIC